MRCVRNPHRRDRKEALAPLRRPFRGGEAGVRRHRQLMLTNEVDAQRDGADAGIVLALDGREEASMMMKQRIESMRTMSHSLERPREEATASQSGPRHASLAGF